MKIFNLEYTTQGNTTYEDMCSIVELIVNELTSYDNVALVGTHEWTDTSNTKLQHKRYILDCGIYNAYVAYEAIGLTTGTSTTGRNIYIELMTKEGALENENSYSSQLMNATCAFSHSSTNTLNKDIHKMYLIYDTDNMLTMFTPIFNTAYPGLNFILAKNKSGKIYFMHFGRSDDANTKIYTKDGDTNYVASFLTSGQCYTENKVYMSNTPISLATLTSNIQDVLENVYIVKNTAINNGTYALIKIDDKYYREMSPHLWIEDFPENN